MIPDVTFLDQSGRTTTLREAIGSGQAGPRQLHLHDLHDDLPRDERRDVAVPDEPRGGPGLRCGSSRSRSTPSSTPSRRLRAYAARYHALPVVAVPDRHAGGRRSRAARLRQLSRRQEQPRRRGRSSARRRTRPGSRSTGSRAPRRCCTRRWGTSVVAPVTRRIPPPEAAPPGDGSRRGSGRAGSWPRRRQPRVLPQRPPRAR